MLPQWLSEYTIWEMAYRVAALLTVAGSLAASGCILYCMSQVKEDHSWAPRPKYDGFEKFWTGVGLIFLSLVLGWLWPLTWLITTTAVPAWFGMKYWKQSKQQPKVL